MPNISGDAVQPFLTCQSKYFLYIYLNPTSISTFPNFVFQITFKSSTLIITSIRIIISTSAQLRIAARNVAPNIRVSR